MPSKGHGDALGLCLDVLADVSLQILLGHHRRGLCALGPSVESLLVQIVAVVTAHITASSSCFSHDVNRPLCGIH